MSNVVYLEQYRKRLQEEKQEDTELMIDEFLIDYDPNLMILIESDEENDDMIKISTFSSDLLCNDNDDDDDDEDGRNG